MVRAADTVIVTAEHIVPVGEPDDKMDDILARPDRPECS
jgi:acyl CoA:acetate/3-ketoacid CoA transferase alpha subunit